MYIKLVSSVYGGAFKKHRRKKNTNPKNKKIKSIQAHKLPEPYYIAILIK